MKRRIFLRNSAMASLAYTILPSCGSSETASERHYKYGLQLYTVRDEMPQGLDKVLEKIASVGYESLEMYGYNEGQYFGHDMAATKALLQKHNLVSPSAHVYNPPFLFEGKDDIWKKAVEDANVLGQNYLIVPWLQEDKRGSVDGYKRLALRLNQAAEMCKAGGLKFAYHNHDFEFAPIDGTTGFDIICKETDASMVNLELDLFWVVYSGKDPKQMMQDLAGRVKLWHIKDMNPETRTNIEIGKGSIDFTSLMAEARSWGVEHYYVEQENYTVSPYDSIEKSFAYMKTISS